MIFDDSIIDSRAGTRISPCLQLLKSVGQWQKSGVLSDKEDGLKGTAVDDLRPLAGSAQCPLHYDKVFGLLGLLAQAISGKITIDYRRDETELSSEFTAAIFFANENSRNLEGAGDVTAQSTTVNSIYALQDVPGRGKGLVARRRSPRAREFSLKRPSLQSMNQSAASSFEHPSASKISGKTSYPCTISTHTGMLLSSISGFFEQTPYLPKPLEIKGQSS
jgi:hypothetical protein